MNQDAGSVSQTAAGRSSSRGRGAVVLFLRLIDWFVPRAYADIPHLRQHVHVFAGSVIVSAPITLTLGLVAFFVVPPQFADLPWFVLLTSGFALFPFLVKWSGRLDLVATAIVQVLPLGLLALASFYGGLLSPALPWLMVAFSATFYFLGPWPRWRNANVILQIAEIAVFAIAETAAALPAAAASDHSLLVMLFCSCIALFAYFQLILVLMWSMNRSRQRQLRNEIAVRKAAEEERASLERQLFQSQKLEAVGKLAGGVAHDFNNLLAVILGRMEIVEEELADRPEIREWVRSAIRAVGRGTTLTNTMLAFARRQPLQPVEIDPSAIVRDLADMLRRTLGETIEVKLAGAPDQWVCRADPGQLQSALLNLAVNARDAMPAGGTLTIATGNRQMDDAAAARIAGAAAGDYVVISVTDTGAGMRPDVAERAFEPFFTTKDTGKGTGLGLSMVNGFVAQSGGHVTIASELGRGTTVDIYLPRLRGARPESAAALPRRAATQPRHRAILVIEDDQEVRDLTKLQLERLGYAVLSGADGAEGLARLGDHPETVLLLCDLVLTGGLDGVEVAKRALALRPDLKVIFMSGYSKHADLPALGVLGTPHLLRKPFHNEDLAAQIRMALEGG